MHLDKKHPRVLAVALLALRNLLTYDGAHQLSSMPQVSLSFPHSLIPSFSHSLILPFSLSLPPPPPPPPPPSFALPLSPQLLHEVKTAVADYARHDQIQRHGRAILKQIR